MSAFSPPRTYALVSTPRRSVAIDAYRGLVMLLMMAEVLRFAAISRVLPGSASWHLLATQQTHVPWVGMSLHDTIQPSFTFLVGVVLPFSIRSRTTRGETFIRSFQHAIRRSFILIALGVALRIFGPDGHTTFIDTLAQIGLGYTFAFLLAHAQLRSLWIAIAAILFAYWWWWAMYPLPPAHLDPASIDVPANWTANQLHGFGAHWNRGWNPAAAFDRWWMARIPTPHRFPSETGGYVTLNFIPTLATMLLGIIAGRWLLAASPRAPLVRFTLTGLALMIAGVACQWSGLCPIVKHVWTPSWVLFSGGICFLALAAFCAAECLKPFRSAALPLLVVGANAIVAYLLAFLAENTLHFADEAASRIPRLGEATLEPLFAGAVVLTLEWLVLLALYRRRIFLKI